MRPIVAYGGRRAAGWLASGETLLPVGSSQNTTAQQISPQIRDGEMELDSLFVFAWKDQVIMSENYRS